ncbi:MAG: hypothetical protein AAF224_09070 [Pseudomonadota bacterium]
MGNASTFEPPVVYETIPAIDFSSFTDEVRHAACHSFIAACERLADQGCRAAISNCSYSIILQSEVAERAAIPIALSAVSQLSLAFKLAPPGARVALLTSYARNYREEYLYAACEAEEIGRVVIIGGDEIPAAQSFLEGRGLDYQALPNGVGDRLAEARREQPRIAVLVSACPGFLPFSDDIRGASGLPVYDVLTLAASLMATAPDY